MIFEDYISEAIKYKYVVRNGKRVRKAKSTKEGKYRIEYDENGKPREVRITASERRKRKLGQKKGKIKRAAKQKNIELKRKKSFIARKNVGLQNYNKKLPDINNNRAPYVPKKPKIPVDKFLGPSFSESFKSYLNKTLLTEHPHDIVFSDDKIDIMWDWCSETTPNTGAWLWQLVNLYKTGNIISLRDDRNEENNKELTLSDEQLKNTTENLKYNFFFLLQANKDFQKASEELKKALKDEIPEELYLAIINFKK